LFRKISNERSGGLRTELCGGERIAPGGEMRDDGRQVLAGESCVGDLDGEDVAARRPVAADEVEMVRGEIDARKVAREEEPDDRPRDALAVELAGGRGRGGGGELRTWLRLRRV
jgi:hypothetical protein